MHAHRGHRRHEKCHADFRAGDRRSTRIGEFHANSLLPFRGVVGSELNSTIPCGALVVDAAPAPGGGGTNEPSAGLKLALGVDQEVCGRNNLLPPLSTPSVTIRSSPTREPNCTSRGSM